MEPFSYNKHPEAIAYIIAYLDASSIAEWLSIGGCDETVECFISHLNALSVAEWFSVNESDEAVKYFIAHPKLVPHSRFSENANPLAVEFLMQVEPSMINWDQWPSNAYVGKIMDNVKTEVPDAWVQFLIRNADTIGWEVLAGCNNKEIVKFVIAKMEEGTPPPSGGMRGGEAPPWEELSENTCPDAIAYLVDHPHRIVWSWFSRHLGTTRVPDACFEANIDKISWGSVKWTDAAVEFVCAHLPQISWGGGGAEPPIGNTHTLLSKCQNNKVIGLLLEHVQPGDLPDDFSANECDAAVDYLIKHPERIIWREFSNNRNRKAVKFIISIAGGTAPFLRMIDWKAFTINPSIYEDDPEWIEFLATVF
jgi:hypothetical protein